MYPAGCILAKSYSIDGDGILNNFGEQRTVALVRLMATFHDAGDALAFQLFVH